MARQREVLNTQNNTINQMLQSKFNQDFILDSTLFVASLYMVNTSLVEYPLSLIMILVTRGSKAGKRSMFLRQLTKTVFMLYIVREMRSILHHYGLYNSVGSLSGYIANVLQMGKK